MEACRIAIVGAGNVAGHLARALAASGADVVQVCARSIGSARPPASALGALPLDNPAGVDPTVDFCIISATDTAIPEIALRLPRLDGIAVHTSGSVPMDALLPAAARVGVLYPLQTFSRGRELDMRCVPFFTEGSDAATLGAIDALAASVSDSVHHADSSTRPLLHVAGVLGCNFPNYLLGCAADVLARGGYSLDVLRPLLQETMAKAFEFGPDNAQTGPAIRGDRSTIARHSSMLPPAQARIYEEISQAIMDKYRK